MHVIFDLDGTLFQTGYCDINAINLLFDEMNLPRINENEIIKNIGKKTDEFLHSLLPENIDPHNYCERFRFLEQIEVAERGKLFNNVEKMLAQLKSNGHNLYICSNGSVEYINLVLNTTGIIDYFEKIVSAKSFKTKSDAVKQIIQINSCIVIVGDTFSDIQAAEENNIPSIGVSYGYGNKDDLSRATYVAQNVIDIIDSVTQCDLFYNITNRIVQRSAKIIGVNGVDTSGKTTFTNHYSKFLKSIGIKTTVLHIDDFHNPSKIRRQGDNEIEAYYNNAFNYRQLIDEVLQPLMINNAIDKDVLCLDLDTDRYEKIIHYAIDNQTLLLIEGVLLFRTPLIDYMDIKIFLQIDFDEVLNRAMTRDVPKYGKEFLQKYINKYIPIQKLYLDKCKPSQIADLVVDNQNFNKPSLRVNNFES